ncbi:MAG: methionyl-tRNA formyltransferase [Acidimicrobiales bacterium]
MARIVYLGTPEVAVEPFRALVDAGHDVPLVVSGPDRRRGRGGKLTPSPVKAAAMGMGLEVTDQLATVVDVGAELGVVVAFGRLIPRWILDELPMVNLHFSLLPRWRGAAPVERAILAGDDKTGVCLMAIDEGLDTGGVLAKAEVAIGRDETAADLARRLADVGTRLLVETLAAAPGGLPPPRPQMGAATYAAKLDPSELRLDWSRSADELARVVRVGRAWTTFRGARLGVISVTTEPAPGTLVGPGTLVDPGTLVGDRVACGSGWLGLVIVQPEGRRAVSAADWLRGARVEHGERLGP